MRLRRSVAATCLLSLVASLGLMAIAGPIAAADDTVEVWSLDFDDESHAPWNNNGGTLTYVDEGAGKALSIVRTQDWHGIKSPTGEFEAGVEYSFSMRARLPEGTAGTREVRFVVELPGYTQVHHWVGNTTIDGDGWTDVSGSLTIPADADAAAGSVYIGTSGAGGDEWTLLIDDVLVTTPGDTSPPPPAAIYTTSFEDGTDGWFGRGDADVELSTAQANEGTQSLLTTGRAANWQGPGLNLLTIDGIEAGALYHIEAYVRLANGTGEANLAVAESVDGVDDWPWVSGWTSVDDTGWTHLEGEYSFTGTATQLELYVEVDNADDFYIDDVTITMTSPPPPPPTTDIDLFFDFEDATLQGWQAREAGDDPHTVDVTTAEAHEGEYAALVSDRDSQGDGLGYDMFGIFETGGTYEITAWVKMAEGQGSDNITLSLQTGSSTFANLETVAVNDTTWTQINTIHTHPSGSMALLYFETQWPDGGHGDFLVDTIRIRTADDPEIQDLPSIWERHVGHFPVGVAIDQRETLGSAADLTTLHFNNVTAENHMKPDAWYDGDRNFQVHEQAAAIMDFAAANDLGVYGHVLVWHSQTPDWFFENESGQPLTNSPADQAFMLDRMEEHIFDIAEALSDEYGLFGSDTNPLNAWDVVNEVVSDSGEHADGLRRSRWYEILGEDFIYEAFHMADEAFNDVYADPASDRPVKLYINDYNTEQSGKQNRYFALIQRMVDAGVPIDGVGHQFHLNLSVPVSLLESTIVRFRDNFDLIQAVTELDVTVGTPVTEANIVEQGYYYRDAFRIFREYSDELDIVTLWGLHDGRSWRGEQAPLAFDGNLQAKPAYYGIMDADLEPRIRTSLVFQGEPEISSDGVDSVVWEQLPLNAVGEVGRFQLRWVPGHLTAYVEVDDPVANDGDNVTFLFDEQSATVNRDGSTDGDVGAVHVEEVDGGYVVLAQLLLDSQASLGDTIDFDVQITTNPTATWADEGSMGTLTLVEELSFVQIPQATTLPAIDGDIDDVWEDAAVVTTDKIIQGDASAATAEVRTLWSDNTLYVLAEITDDQIDVSGSDPWVQDSLEIFIDAGNYKNGPYRHDDMQLRISATNQLSFGTGDEALQAARVDSATSETDDGYIVEVAISLLEEGGLGTFHGLDFQVNDGTNGTRTGIRNWADPTGLGYQSTSRWGVAQLVDELDDTTEPPTTPPGRPSDRPVGPPSTTPPTDRPIGPPPGVPGAAAAIGRLPRTGADAWLLLMVGFGMMAAGAGAIEHSRRRKGSTTDTLS